MAIDYFIGVTEAQLVVELRRCQAELLAGKTVISSGAGDLQFGERVEMSITDRIAMILRALSKLNPAAYPPESTTPIDRTRANFQNFLFDSEEAN